MKITPETLVIVPLESDVAFVKGVEYAVELVVLYGLIGALSIYEIQKSIKASKKLNSQFKDLESYNVNQEHKIRALE